MTKVSNERLDPVNLAEWTDKLLSHLASKDPWTYADQMRVRGLLVSFRGILRATLAKGDAHEGGEPVAWECVDANGDVHITRSRAEMETWDQTDVFVRPLYTHPKEAEVAVTEEMVERAGVAIWNTLVGEEAMGRAA